MQVLRLQIEAVVIRCVAVRSNLGVCLTVSVRTNRRHKVIEQDKIIDATTPQPIASHRVIECVRLPIRLGIT